MSSTSERVLSSELEACVDAFKTKCQSLETSQSQMLAAWRAESALYHKHTKHLRMIESMIAEGVDDATICTVMKQYN